MWEKKVKSGALQLTLYIAVIVTILLLSFTLIISYHKKNQYQSSFIIESIKNNDRGIFNSLELESYKNDSIHLNLFEKDYKSLKVQISTWGLFKKIATTSSIKTNTTKKIVLVGHSKKLNDRAALYVNDNNKPLILVGSTKIVGNVYLPKQGIKSGYISGHSFYGNQLVNGKKYISNSQIPELSDETITSINELKEKVFNAKESQFIDIDKEKSFYNSFFNPFKIVLSKQELNLSYKSFTGHIYLYSDKKITVQNSTTLKDVILIAPEIEIKPGFKGSFQAIAKKRINLGRGSKLNYPTVLCVKNSVATESNQPNINIEDNCVVNGSIFFESELENINYDSQVFIGKQSIINGEVVCNQNLELQGTVYGSIYANNFLTKAYGSIFQNHLFNVNINSLKLNENFSGLCLNEEPNSLVKCLY